MATYASYKTLTSENFTDGSVTSAKLGPGAGHQYYVKWIYNERGKRCEHCADARDCCEQANGKCCYWCVPDNTYKVTFEIWSGGGGGPGHTCCNCCSFSVGGHGGGYASRTIDTNPNCKQAFYEYGTSTQKYPVHKSVPGTGIRDFNQYQFKVLLCTRYTSVYYYIL